MSAVAGRVLLTGEGKVEEREYITTDVCSQNKLDNLSSLATRRKTKLMDNSAYLQFMWKADVVESWIADKETHVRSEEFGRDLSTVQTLLTKQETFDAGE